MPVTSQWTEGHCLCSLLRALGEGTGGIFLTCTSPGNACGEAQVKLKFCFFFKSTEFRVE